MNLSDFKLLKEDDEHYEVAHPNGKSLKVAKKGLSEKAHRVIKKMQKFAEGGAVQPEDFVPGTDYSEAPLPGDANATLDQPAYGEPGGELRGGLPDHGGVEVTPQPTLSPAPAPTNAPAPASLPETAPSAQDPIATEALDMNQSLQKEKEAILAGAAAEGAEGATSSKAYKDYIDKLELLPTPQDIFQKHQAQDQALFDAYQNKKLDPDRYWHDKTTGSKITAGIGLLLSGMGSATTGQPNFALQAIDSAIKRDIEAQANDQSKAMNLWKMNREATQDEAQATLATQNQYLNAVKAKAMQAAAGAQSALTRARVAPLLAQIDQQIQANNFKRATLSAGANGFSTIDPASLVTSLVPQEHQKQVFTEIGQAQNAARNEKPMLDAFQKLDQENSALGRAGRLGFTPPSSKVFDALADPLIHDNEGRINELEQKHVQALKPQPFDRPETVKEKLDGLKAFIESKKSAPTAKGFGIDLNHFASTSSDPRSKFTPQQAYLYNKAVARLKQDPNDVLGRDTLAKLGLQ